MTSEESAGPVSVLRDRVFSALRQSIFLVSLPFPILGFVLPIYGKEIGASAVEIGLFFSTFALMTVLLRPIVGVALDRLGRKPFLLAGIAGYATTMVAFAFMAQVWGIVAARTLQGVASAFMWLAARAIVADVAAEDDRGRSFGNIDQVSSQGGMLGTFIGFTVLMWQGIEHGWQPLFLGYAAASLIGFYLAWRQMPETNPAFHATPGAAPDRIVWSRTWILLLLVTLITGAAWALTSPILMIFLQEKMNTDVADLAWAFLPSALVWAFLPGRLGGLADRFGRKPLMLLGLAVASVTSFAVPHLTSLAQFAVLWAVLALAYAAGDPAEQALVADLTGRDQRGRAFGIYTLAAGLGATIGPLVGGWLYDSFGKGTPFYATAVVLAVNLVILAIWLKVPAPVRVQANAGS
jgi:MFS transporter, DHA1 family, multidrug resistance protein